MSVLMRGALFTALTRLGANAGEAGEDVDATEGVVGERAGFAFVVVGEELGFVGGHVDGDGTLGLTGFAGEAEVERLFDLLVLPLVGEDFALHELPKEVSAAAGGVEFFAGGHEAGAHGAGIGFAAGADAYAAEIGCGEGAVVFGEGEVGFGLPGFVVGAEAKVFVRLVGVDEFAGVHAVGRVEDVLEGAEGHHELFAEHLGEESATGLAIAMFAGERATVGESDVGGAVDELAEVEDAGFGFEIEVEAHVHAALAEVAVHCAGVVELLHQRVDGAEIAAELRGIDGGILPSLPPGTDAGDECGGAKAGLADVPDAFGFVRGVEASGGLGGQGFEVGGEGARFGVGFGLGRGAELNDEESVAGWEQGEIVEGFLFAAEGVEKIAVHAFEADGFELEDLRHVVGGEEDVREADAEEGAAGWGFDELKSCAEDDGAGAFAADEGAGEVEGVFREQFVEVEAGDAAGDVGKLLADEVGVGVAKDLE